MGLKGILVDSDSLALQGQAGTKEIQVIRGSLVKQVWWVRQAPEVDQDFQVFLVKQVSMVLQACRAAQDSRVLLDHWDFMDWMD